MKSYECFQTLRENPALSKELMQSRQRKDSLHRQLKSKKCKNTKSITGFEFEELFLPSSKIISEKRICYTPSQYKIFTQSKNSKNSKNSKKKIQHIKDLTIEELNSYNIPLELILRPTVCPSHLNTNTLSNPTQRFLISPFPVDWNTIPDHTFFDQIPGLVTKYSNYKWLNTIPLNIFYTLNSKFVYLFSFHHPLYINPMKYNKEEIKSISLIRTQFESLPYPIGPLSKQEKSNFIQILYQYIRGSLQLTKDQMEQLSYPQIKLPYPIVAYRGLYLSFEDIQQFHYESLKLNDRVPYPIVGAIRPISSWTTDLCVAEYFATSFVMKKINQPIKFGLVLKDVLFPSQVILDTRLLTIEDFSDVRGQSQMEILVNTSSLQKSQCIVEELWVIKGMYRIPIKNMKDIIPYMH